MSYGTRLSREAAAYDIYDHIILSGNFQEFERLTHYEFKSIKSEIIVQTLFVDGYSPIPCGKKTNAGGAPSACVQ